MLKNVYVFLMSFFAFIGVASAAGPDFTGMTGQIDWSTATAAILLVAGGLAAVYVVLTGSSMINGKIAKGK